MNTFVFILVSKFTAELSFFKMRPYVCASFDVISVTLSNTSIVRDVHAFSFPQIYKGVEKETFENLVVFIFAYLAPPVAPLGW